MQFFQGYQEEQCAEKLLLCGFCDSVEFVQYKAFSYELRARYRCCYIPRKNH